MISFSDHVHREAKRPSSKVGLVTFNLQPTISNYRLLRTRSEGPKARSGPVAFPPPSPTDDHRPPTPTVVAEVTCGERRREAFGTCARVAGSLVSVASPAASLKAAVIRLSISTTMSNGRMARAWVDSPTGLDFGEPATYSLKSTRTRFSLIVSLENKSAPSSPLEISLNTFPSTALRLPSERFLP